MMTDREYERNERRRRTREKGRVTSIIAGIVIALAVAAIVIVVIALVSKNNSQQPTAEPTIVATEQPTMYIPETKPTETTSRSATAYTAPTQSQYVAPTAAPVSVETAASAEPANPGETRQGGSSSAVGGELHYYAYGKTSYGYDWTYSGGAGVVSITCKYNFQNQQYDFIITGTNPGTTGFILYYNADDNQQISVPMSVTVSSDLKVTQN